ncbi:MAG: ATP-binding protein [Thermoguttaceae bacterium]|jgi:two-component system NtrC family sensor kinase|nr:ATP-binding protein [Thermoguttaceae bacterium]
MDDKPKAFYQSLGFRLLVPLFVTVGAVLAVHAVIGFRSNKEHFLRFVRGDIHRYSGLIKRATHDGMLLNRKDEVQAIIERLADGSEIAAVRVYDKEGLVAMSADRNEIGDRIWPGSETCRSCHTDDEKARDEAVLEQSGFARSGDGVEVLRQLTVIENEPSCSTAACHAHPADQRVLGVLDLEMSMAPVEAATQTAQRQFLWTTLVLVGIVGAVAAVFIRRLVHRPVFQLYQATRRIADGDLDTRIEVRGGHELARLAEAFNQMARDLGDARREVIEWSQKLEEKVIEKTEELRRAERQVLHMEKMASLGKLSATVAHELNNPISGILAYARLVRRELDEQPLEPGVRDELTRYLGWMEKECGRCGAIVQNLLVFARRTGAAMAPVDLNEVVERSLMLVRHHLEISGVRLRSEFLSGDSQIVADAGQLQQALVALLVNAVEAMNGPDADYAELSVRLSGDADEVRIEIGDTGVGIPPDVLPHIFEPFFSTKEKENGVGLGLAVVYGIVRRHGGQIDVESEAGRGSVFRLRLPRKPPEHCQDDLETAGSWKPVS